ncbi:5-(carboxyamino)imidazole ribonucleotide synthase [Candidatus Nitrosocosmicus hydrocola]|uniref:5-(carboxyamino)imidazole ribonucleotide synthase n=1 Tax=Candidatus Nitrosocosmicus hydrocola TaxID=1826872 RepID=UPI000ACBA926|nr:5-(carboxyamino)imidazole ribonucleotide synthase [Candidatus Nitrosocosmicus hydrocola]
MTLYKDKFSVTEPIRLGIIGGGQLGKMLAMEAKRMFMKVVILDPTINCPASCIADKVIEGSFSDEQKINELAQEVDLVTYEIELANATALNNLEQSGVQVHPSPKTLSIIQNKFRQKKFLRENKIDVPDFEFVLNEEQVNKVCSEYGFPVLLKACENSYDGRGNYLIRSQSEIKIALEYFSGRECMLEKFVNFKKEISIMIARNASGCISYFPVVENIHEEHILKTTIAPARISKVVEGKAIDLAVRTMESLKGSGIFGIEMFLGEDDEVLINEIAPRPHNSGHYSIEACSISQFEQHIRAILDYPMPQPRLESKAVMMNILGPPDLSGPYFLSGIREILALPGVRIHLYGKADTKPKRKLGHITILISDNDPLVTKDNVEKYLMVQAAI